MKIQTKHICHVYFYCKGDLFQNGNILLRGERQSHRNSMMRERERERERKKVEAKKGVGETMGEVESGGKPKHEAQVNVA